MTEYKSLKFFPVKTEKMRNSICDLIKKKLRIKFEKYVEGESLYLQPENTSAIDTFFSRNVLSDKFFISNNVKATAEVKTISELLQTEIIEDDKHISNFDQQLINYLETVKVVKRDKAPKEFFTPYSSSRLCVSMFLLYLFLILVVRTGGDLYNY